MPITEGTDMVFEGPLVLEIRTTDAEPKLPTILLVCSPIPSHCKCLPTLPALEWLPSVLPFVVCLEGPEILQWP